LQDDLAVAKSGRVYLDDFCRDRTIPLLKVRSINGPETVAAIQDARLDWLLIIGWSQIAKLPVLRGPRHGVLGIHPTLLPIGRGRASVPWAILHELEETGVSLFKLDEGVDTGPVVAQVRIPIVHRETATSLYDKVIRAHRELILASWSDLTSGKLRLVPQDDAKATVWAGRRPEDGRLDRAMSLAEADRLVRAVTRPYPGAFMDIGGRRLRVWSALPIGGVPGGLLQAQPDGALGPQLAFREGALQVTAWDWEE
jgi:methionyl-tRNA formyltransferase